MDGKGLEVGRHFLDVAVIDRGLMAGERSLITVSGVG